jgi:hypothetical protein
MKNFTFVTRSFISFHPTTPCALCCTGIHKRVCKAIKSQENTIDFGGFLAALLICAQIKNNDTFKRSTAILSSAESLQELFTKNILPFAVKMEYKSILKENFCADDLLYSLRSHHDDMFKVFEKYCTRGHVKDSPSSLRTDDMAAMLVDAGMCH